MDIGISTVFTNVDNLIVLLYPSIVFYEILKFYTNHCCWQLFDVRHQFWLYVIKPVSMTTMTISCKVQVKNFHFFILQSMIKYLYNEGHIQKKQFVVGGEVNPQNPLSILFRFPGLFLFFITGSSCSGLRLITEPGFFTSSTDRENDLSNDLVSIHTLLTIASARFISNQHWPFWNTFTIS
ncbi:hypothetical protein AGLY_013477 [Aphis glycines]|uniref:Uncharacterized protein n=1 Tax=Aphis glycines TaxID=307491 RepID=A0A6G0T8I7_APHGL|nr:hypothetical protein AGLY_013477 [Aphis glycines]